MRKWLFVIILGLLTACAPQKEAAPTAQSGTLDLTRWDFATQGIVALNGTWEFYWQQLLLPADFQAAPRKSADVSVPSGWIDYRLDGQPVPGHGYATYRLIVQINHTNQLYGLRITGIDTAYRIWANGQEVLADGVVGTTRQTTIPHNDRQTVFLTLSSAGGVPDRGNNPTTLELVIQVANFHNLTGGIWSSAYFGLAKDIARSQAHALARDLFLCGGLLVIGLYHFGLYSLRRKDRHTLYFGLFCILIALRTIVMGENFLSMFPSGLSWTLLVKIEYITFYWGLPVFVAFLKTLYPAEFAGTFTKTLQIAGMLGGSLVLLTPPLVFTPTLPYFQLLTLIAGAYWGYCIIQTIRRRREYAFLIGSAQMVLLGAVINDILHAKGLIDTGFSISFGLIIFVLMQSLALSARFASIFAKVEALSEQLRLEIVERQHAEVAIRENEERYRQLVEHSPDGLFVHQAGQVIYANPAMANLLRATQPSDLIGLQALSFVHPQYHASVKERIRQNQDEGNAVPLVEEQFIGRDGTVIDVEVAATVYLYQGQRASQVIVRDITARKRIERELETYRASLEALVQTRTAELAVTNTSLTAEIGERRQAEQALAAKHHLLRTLIDNIPDQIYVKDAESRFLLANLSTAHNLGMTNPEQLLGKTDVDFFPAELAAQFSSVERDIIASGRPMFNREEPNPDPVTGEIHWVLSTKAPFYDAQGTLVGLVGSNRDITERKRIESALQQAHAELQQLMAEELRQRQIAESLRDIAVMLNSSLDLKTVLEKIMAQLQRVVRYDSAAILLQDGENLVVYSGLEIPESAKGKSLSLASHDPSSRVFQQKIPLCFADVRADPHWQIWPEAEQIRAWIGVPLLTNETVLGVLTADSFTIDAYCAEDVRVLQIFANQAALAIHNARRFEVETRLRQEAETLRAATQALSTSLNLQQVFELILTELRKVVAYDSASVQQLRGDFLEIIGGDGFPNLPELLGMRFDITAADNPNQEVIRTQAPVMIDDVQAVYEVFRNGPHAMAYIHSWLGVPLLFGDRLLGMISLDHRTPGFYTQEHANVAMAFAAQAAIAIRNAQLYQETQREKQLFETLMLNSPVATVMADPTGAIVLWNPAAERLFGYARSEVVGRHLDELVTSPAMLAEGLAYMRQMLDGRTIRVMTQRPRKDGALVDVELSAVPVLVDQQRVALLALYHDITDLKRAEAKLIAANSELHDTLDHLQRAQTQLIEAEKMAAFGKLVANIAHEINTPLGAIRASTVNIAAALAETTRDLPPLLRALPSEQYEQFLALLARAAQPKPAITSREERAHRRAVQRELEAADIANADNIADTFVDMGIYADVTPVLTLLQSEQVLPMLQAAYRLASQHHHSANILAAVERMSKIIFALKSYAHADASGEVTSARVTDGLDVVLTLYYNQLKQGIEVVKQYADTPPIRCYPDDLNQVWTNLIHNAIQAMQGKGRLEIGVRPEPVEGREMPPGTRPSTGSGRTGGVVVEITDSGPGIPDAIKHRIFEPFFTTKPAGEGSGLGLDICRKIIDKHQGKIEVESQPGRTTFRVWLPAHN